MAAAAVATAALMGATATKPLHTPPLMPWSPQAPLRCRGHPPLPTQALPPPVVLLLTVVLPDSIGRDPGNRPV